MISIAALAADAASGPFRATPRYEVGGWAL